MLLLIPLAIAGIVLYFLFRKKKLPANAPPVAHIGIPLIGNYIEFATNPVAFVAKCLEKFGEIYTVPMLHKRLTFLLGPEVSAPFYQLSDESMSQSEVYGFMTPVFGKNVVYDAEPKKRGQQFQCMAVGLKSGRLKAYVPKIELETIQYVDTILNLD